MNAVLQATKENILPALIGAIATLLVVMLPFGYAMQDYGTMKERVETIRKIQQDRTLNVHSVDGLAARVDGLEKRSQSSDDLAKVVIRLDARLATLVEATGEVREQIRELNTRLREIETNEIRKQFNQRSGVPSAGHGKAT